MKLKNYKFIFSKYVESENLVEINIKLSSCLKGKQRGMIIKN